MTCDRNRSDEQLLPDVQEIVLNTWTARTCHYQAKGHSHRIVCQCHRHVGELSRPNSFVQSLDSGTILAATLSTL